MEEGLVRESAEIAEFFCIGCYEYFESIVREGVAVTCPFCNTSRAIKASNTREILRQLGKQIGASRRNY